MKMLFIGGSQDGKMVEVPVRQNTQEVSNLSRDQATNTSAPAGTVERYRRVSISLCEMMLVDYLPVGEVIPRLMGGYRPEVKS